MTSSDRIERGGATWYTYRGAARRVGRHVQRIKEWRAQGMPMEFVAPREGAVVLLTAQCVLANNPDTALARKLANYLISPEAQALAMENGSYNPVNPKVTLEGKAADEQARMNEMLKAAVVVDWDVINAERPNWNKRWNRTVER